MERNETLDPERLKLAQVGMKKILSSFSRMAKITLNVSSNALTYFEYHAYD